MVVTGASSGIGRSTALAFGRAGARVVLASRREDRLWELSTEIDPTGARTLVVPTDVSDRAAAERLVERTLAHWGQIDVLVANAGTYVRVPVTEVAVEDFERSLAVNFYGSLYPVLAALPSMLARRRGHLIIVSSAGGRKGIPPDTPYSSAKGALTGFADVARQELRGHGIRVTTVMPGRVATPFVAGVHFHPISRPIPPERVAEAIVRATTSRRPPAEIIQPFGTRFILLAAAVSPRFADWGVRRFRLSGWTDESES